MQAYDKWYEDINMYCVYNGSWKSIEENHIMMALLDRYHQVMITLHFEIVISTGERQTKLTPITLSTSGFPSTIMVSLQIREKKYMPYSTFSIKSSLLAVGNKVNIVALKIHMWAEHLVFAECRFFFLTLSLED